MKLLVYLPILIFTLSSKQAFAFDQQILWSKQVSLFFDPSRVVCEEVRIGIVDRDQPAVFNVTLTLNYDIPELPGAKRLTYVNSYGCQEVLKAQIQRVDKIRSIETLTNTCRRGLCNCEVVTFYAMYPFANFEYGESNFNSNFNSDFVTTDILSAEQCSQLK